MGAETDRYIVASAALWAGDVHKFRELVGGTPYEMDLLSRKAEGPEQIIASTAALRLRQLGQKKAEFSRIAKDDAVDMPLILQTTHLRATVWRTGVREFSLLGYLTSLNYEKSLFAQVAQEREEVGQSRRESKYAPYLPTIAGGIPPRLPLGGGWVKEGNPFLQIEVGDMGLIEATAIWTEKQLPRDSLAIAKPFHDLLLSLDPSQQQNTHAVVDE